MDPIRTGPRQMWELDQEAEKALASRSIWVRGLGLGRTTEEVMPLLERTGDRTQRVRVYRMDAKDRYGEYAAYVTYESEEAAKTNMTRLRSHLHAHHRLIVIRAKPEGAYRPLTQEMKDRIRLRNLTKSDRKQIQKKKETSSKVAKIREKLQKMAGVNGSPTSENGNKSSSSRQPTQSNGKSNGNHSERDSKVRQRDHRGQLVTGRKETSGSPVNGARNGHSHSGERGQSNNIRGDISGSPANLPRIRPSHSSERGQPDHIRSDKTGSPINLAGIRPSRSIERDQTNLARTDTTGFPPNIVGNRPSHSIERGQFNIGRSDITSSHSNETGKLPSHYNERGQFNIVRKESSGSPPKEANSVGYSGDRSQFHIGRPETTSKSARGSRRNRKRRYSRNQSYESLIDRNGSPSRMETSRYTDDLALKRKYYDEPSTSNGNAPYIQWRIPEAPVISPLRMNERETFERIEGMGRGPRTPSAPPPSPPSTAWPQEEDMDLILSGDQSPILSSLDEFEARVEKMSRRGRGEKKRR